MSLHDAARDGDLEALRVAWSGCNAASARQTRRERCLGARDDACGRQRVRGARVGRRAEALPHWLEWKTRPGLCHASVRIHSRRIPRRGPGER